MFNEIQCAMKPSTGGKNAHLSWFLPFACFVDFFSDSQQLRRSKTTFMCKLLDEAWFDSLLEKGWIVKIVEGDDLI